MNLREIKLRLRDFLFGRKLFLDVSLIRENVERIVRIANQVEHDSLTIKSAILNRSAFVLLYSPAIGIIGQKVRVLPGVEQRITFNPVIPIPPGAHISVVGDAFISDVTVGNMAQTIAFPSESPICITRDPCEMGMLIRVGVKALHE